MTSWLWGTSQVDELVDKATSELLPAGSEDIALNLEICDQIRSKTVPAKDAVKSLKRRLNHKNPNVQLLALGLTDVCIKNGGDHFLQEIAARDFMDNLVSILRMPALNYEVKNKLLRLIQNWAIAFEGKPSLAYVPQVYKTLKAEGFNFPPKDPTVLSAAMVDTQTAPEWIDSDLCLRCRDPFSFTNRKHHCRNCGQVFDQNAPPGPLPLPHFGISDPVRVCDNCHPKLLKHASQHKPSTHHGRSYSQGANRHRHQRDFEDAELQRAIQLSLSEMGSSHANRPGYVPEQPTDWYLSEPPLVDRKTRPIADDEDDPDLKTAIEASLREANAPRPSAPVALETPRSDSTQPYFAYAGPGYSQSYPPASVPTPQPSVPSLPNYDLAPLESDVILTFNQAVEHVQAQHGQDILRYPAINELHHKATTLTPKLTMSIEDTNRKHEVLTDMHTKLSQAVKIYDRLLTEQVSRPTWQSSQPTSYAPSTSIPYTPSYASPAPAPWSSPAQSTSHSEPQMTSGYTSAVSLTSYQPPQQVTSPVSYSPQQPWQPDSLQQRQQYSAPTPAASIPPQNYAPSSVIPGQVQSPPPSAHANGALPASQPASAYSPPSSLSRQPTYASYAPPHQQATQAAPSLPSFPAVPTAAPQAVSMYSSPAPPAERKEALLIDL